MIDFATLKGVAIPEGNVTQIADASGAVLWKAAPAGAKVKVTLNNGGSYASQTISPNAYFRIDGVTHNTAEEIVLPIGTAITFYASRGSGGTSTNKIYLNGAEVSYNTNDRYSATFNYVLTGDIEVVLRSSMTMSGMSPNFESKVHITEL